MLQRKLKVHSYYVTVSYLPPCPSFLPLLFVTTHRQISPFYIYKPKYIYIYMLQYIYVYILIYPLCQFEI